jgi:lipopolysaccharide heptosyltransferase I
MNLLIVRLGALGDIVHTVPAAAALRRTFPDARIDWVVDARHAAFASLVTSVDRIIRLEKPSVAAWVNVVRQLRWSRYDVALDFQGLMKSAVLARASGARRVIGFSIWHLREKTARPFYTGVEAQDLPAHMIQKNLSLLTTVGINSTHIEFPLAHVPSAALEHVKQDASGRPFAIINAGAAWPNKRWPAARFGEVAAFLREVRGIQPYVVWGSDEKPLAAEVVRASGGAAHLAPPTTTEDLVALSREAVLLVSGDTGPLHIAAAVGTPVVAIFGPTDPARNGPWSVDDTVVSRYSSCGCHYERRCRQTSWCLTGVEVAEVTAAVQHRLASAARVRTVPGE